MARLLNTDGMGVPLACEGHSLVYDDGVLGRLSHMADAMGTERWRKVSDVAQVVANYLRCHPRVEEVCYPGLKFDPLFKEASHTLASGFGPLVWYQVAGEWHELSCDDEDPRQAVLWMERLLGGSAVQGPSLEPAHGDQC